MSYSVQTDEVRGRVEQAERVVVPTSAGISTESDIPDFRDPQGACTKNARAEKRSDIGYYMTDPGVRRRRESFK